MKHLTSATFEKEAWIGQQELKRLKKDSKNVRRDYNTRKFLASKLGMAFMFAILPFYIFFKKASKAPAISMMLMLALPLAIQSFA